MNGVPSVLRRVVLALSALGVAASAPSALGPRYGGALRVGVLELPAAEPATPRSADERLLTAMVHETLVQAGAEGQALPALAGSWSSAASGREWVVKLREGAAFHDGAPVTADDVVRSLRRFLRSPSPAAQRMAASLADGAAFRARQREDLAGLDARTARSITLRLEAPRTLPLVPLASPAAAITGGTGAGAGPFAPAAAVAGRRASFAAAGMHVRGRPYLDRVDVTALPESAFAAELQSGRIDLAPGGRGGPLAAVLMLAIDPSRPPFDQRSHRTTVATAVDRENLVRHLIPGGEAGAALLPPLLLPAGAPETGLRSAGALRARVTMAVSREVPSLVSQRVVAHLTDLGLQVIAEPRTPSRVLDAPPATLRLWVWTPEVAEPGLALHELSSLAPEQPEVQQALAAADAEPDLDRRRAHLHRAEEALRAEHVLVPLAAAPSSFRAVRRLQGVRVDAAGRVLVEDAWWEP